MIDTGKTRTEFETALASASTNQTYVMMKGLLLLCDILDELRQNAANRAKALENWNGAPVHDFGTLTLRAVGPMPDGNIEKDVTA